MRVGPGTAASDQPVCRLRSQGRKVQPLAHSATLQASQAPNCRVLAPSKGSMGHPASAVSLKHRRAILSLPVALCLIWEQKTEKVYSLNTVIITLNGNYDPVMGAELRECRTHTGLSETGRTGEWACAHLRWARRECFLQPTCSHGQGVWP